MACGTSGFGFWRCGWQEVGSIDMVLASNTDQREQRVAPGVGQRRAHAMWCGCLADCTYWPIRRDPFSRGVGKDCAEPDNASIVVDGSSLHRRDLILA